METSLIVQVIGIERDNERVIHFKRCTCNVNESISNNLCLTKAGILELQKSINDTSLQQYEALKAELPNLKECNISI